MRRLLYATLTASLSLSGCNLRDRDLPPAYRELAVPAERLVSPDVQRQGRAIFRERCVPCHGEAADGKGVRAADLSTPPRNLTDGAWQSRTDDRHVYYYIAEGRRGTAMASWKPTLSPGEIWSLVAYIRLLVPRPATTDDSGPPNAVPPGAVGQDRR
jgi:mono/diheme cytochrome c family protein